MFLVCSNIRCSLFKIKLAKQANNYGYCGKVDSNWQFYYYRDHYWDNTDFASGCVLRSPIYANKLKNYMERLTVQHPDSIYASAVRIIEKARHH